MSVWFKCWLVFLPAIDLIDKANEELSQLSKLLSKPITNMTITRTCGHWAGPQQGKSYSCENWFSKVSMVINKEYLAIRYTDTSKLC